LLKRFDGTTREPRASQIEALGWLADNWNSPGLVLQLPTGVGKSAFARAIQLQTGAAIITPNNALLDQYGDSYPELNTLRGAATYPCGIGDDHGYCDDSCQYLKARTRAEREPTVFNPMSYIYGPVDTDVVIVDEAHKLLEFLRLLINYKFSKARYNPPKEPDAAWIRSKERYYRSLGSTYAERKDVKKASMAFQSAKRLKRIADLLEANPDDFVTYWKDDDWYVEPIEVPRDVIERALGGAEKVILLSATIPQKWAKQVLGHRKFEFLDLSSPIPKENRKIVFDPAGLKAGSEPVAIAAWIKKQLARYEGNAIVHTTYSMGLALSKFFPDALVHTKQTKQSTLRKFKVHGGLWIAAGASEGIDLAGDTGRVNLIPVLPFANNREPLGAALFERDPYDYYLQTAIQFIQQCGRTTRGVDDFSTTICGDNRMSWLLQKCRADLPKSFVEAIQWN
jgi:Rad3-related DNA helicase